MVIPKNFTVFFVKIFALPISSLTGSEFFEFLEVYNIA